MRNTFVTVIVVSISMFVNTALAGNCTVDSECEKGTYCKEGKCVISKEGPDSSVELDPQEPTTKQDEVIEERKKYIALTGMDLSYWVYKGETMVGPGLMWGLVLVPRHFEMTFTFGMMLDEKMDAVPVELSFNLYCPNNIRWKPYLSFGPTLILENRIDREHDWAISIGAGMELAPPTFDWGVYVEGDYNLRVLGDVSHQGGFTLGFRYRFGKKQMEKKWH